MSLVYLMATNLLVMLIVLFTLSHRQLRKVAGYITLIAPIVTSAYFIMKIPDVIRNKFIAVQLPWMPSIDINLDLRLDGLSLMFGLIISLIGVGVFFYATQYLSHSTDNLPRFFIYLLLFMFSMIGIVIA
ncbi:MAG: cation:proton antiporter, partial [Staphylococcus epidermidis]|nr:cation:proton antiporter [Staphylococcus epidermidis]